LLRNTTFLVGVILFFSGGAAGQLKSADSFSMVSTATPSLSPVDFDLTLPAVPLPNGLADSQSLQGVFPQFDWQAYLGYTYVRFFQVPGTQVNTNGLNFSLVYYMKSWLGADGELVSTFGTQFGDNAKFLMGLGGVRVRHAMSRGIEVWAHGLAGEARYLPQTAYGKESAFSFEVGGGVDLNPHGKRIGYRLSVDAAGTNFFGTYQVSPKISAGVVFKF
jgi:hypothetical protein